MATALTGHLRSSTYGDCLQMGNAGAGVTGSLLNVVDGLGNSTALSLSSVAADVAAAFTVSTAVGGTVIHTFNSVVSGASVTSNFYNLTGTLAATGSAEMRGVFFRVTTAGSHAQTIRGLWVNLNAGYTGSASTQSVAAQNVVAGTGASAWSGGAANYCANFSSNPSSAGHAVGTISAAANSSTLNIGALGTATITGATLNVGTVGMAIASTTNVGVFAYLNSGSTTPTFNGSSALVADNAVNTNGDIAQFNTAGVTLGRFDPNGIVQSGGDVDLNSAFTDATGTLAATNLSVTLQASTPYIIEGILQVSNSLAADGSQFSFNGGSVTATTFFVAFNNVGSVVAGTTTSTTLAGVLNYTTNTGTDYIYVRGYLLTNAAGTFAMKAATNTHVSGTMTLGIGSWLSVRRARGV